jgi:membrane-associated phospholipid phosphatase
MEGIYELGIDVILLLQNLPTWIIPIMEFFTFLGVEEFYLFIAPLVLWCFDIRLGLTIGMRLMISGSLNSILKLAFHNPRPYWYDERVVSHAAESSFGVPSGHAQNAVVFWGTIAAWIGRLWAWIIAILIMFLIGLSRMFLGVHFLHDLLLGWLVGVLLLWLLIIVEPPILAWVKRNSRSNQLQIVFVFSLGIILAGALVQFLLSSWQLPPEWLELATKAQPEADSINPLALSGIVSNAAVFFGLALGAIILDMRQGFDATGPFWQRVVRFLVGIIGVFILWYGLGSLFPRGEDLLSYILRYLRYSLVGLWVSALAPLLFIRLKLAVPAND